MSYVFLCLGSNLGDRESNLLKGFELLARRVTIEFVSSIYETEPVGFQEQPWFLNVVCQCTTQLDPFNLLVFAKEIENEMGRVPDFRNAPRPIDIDILFYEDHTIETDDLTVPHPRIGERAFVLIPLVEIAPSFIHPLSGKSMSALLLELNEKQEVRKWGNVPNIGSAAF